MVAFYIQICTSWNRHAARLLYDGLFEGTTWKRLDSALCIGEIWANSSWDFGNWTFSLSSRKKAIQILFARLSQSQMDGIATWRRGLLGRSETDPDSWRSFGSSCLKVGARWKWEDSCTWTLEGMMRLPSDLLFWDAWKIKISLVKEYISIDSLETFARKAIRKPWIS